MFYDFQYISLVLARTNMAENPKKKLVPKSRSIEEDKDKNNLTNWINNIIYGITSIYTKYFATLPIAIISTIQHRIPSELRS